MSNHYYYYFNNIFDKLNIRFSSPTVNEGRKIFRPFHFLPMEDTMSQLNYIAEQVSYFGYDISNFPVEIFPEELESEQDNDELFN